MDDLGGFPPIFGSTPIWNNPLEREMVEISPLSVWNQPNDKF